MHLVEDLGTGGGGGGDCDCGELTFSALLCSLPLFLSPVDRWGMTIDVSCPASRRCQCPCFWRGSVPPPAVPVPQRCPCFWRGPVLLAGIGASTSSACASGGERCLHQKCLCLSGACALLVGTGAPTSSVCASAVPVPCWWEPVPPPAVSVPQRCPCFWRGPVPPPAVSVPQRCPCFWRGPVPPPAVSVPVPLAAAVLSRVSVAISEPACSPAMARSFFVWMVLVTILGPFSRAFDAS